MRSWCKRLCHLIPLKFKISMVLASVVSRKDRIAWLGHNKGLLGQDLLAERTEARRDYHLRTSGRVSLFDVDDRYDLSALIGINTIFV